MATSPVAMHGLDHEAPGRAQDAADLGERLDVLLVAVEAERREEVQRGVEALVGEGQLAVVGVGERSTPVTRKPPRASGMAWRPYPQGTSSRSPPAGQAARRAALWALAPA